MSAELRHPFFSTAMLYLAAGYGLGLAGWPLMSPDPLTDSVILDRVAEVAVLLSLFAVVFKRCRPLSDKGWRLPARLAIVSMTITVALIAAIGVFGLGLSFGGAVLLGAILAPTPTRYWPLMSRWSRRMIAIVCASASPGKAA